MKVLMTYLGDFWIDEQRAARVAEIVNSGKVSIIEFDGNRIMLPQIQGIVKTEVYMTNARTKKRNWTCKHGSSHSCFEVCQCAVNLSKPTNALQLQPTNQLTPAQQAERDRKTAANLAWMNMFKHNFKNPQFKDKAKRVKFLEEYKIRV